MRHSDVFLRQLLIVSFWLAMMALTLIVLYVEATGSTIAALYTAHPLWQLRLPTIGVVCLVAVLTLVAVPMLGGIRRSLVWWRLRTRVLKERYASKEDIDAVLTSIVRGWLRASDLDNAFLMGRLKRRFSIVADTAMKKRGIILPSFSSYLGQYGSS